MSKQWPYHLCWGCNRKFQGAFHRVVQLPEGAVFVHVDCVGMVLREHGDRATLVEQEKP